MRIGLVMVMLVACGKPAPAVPSGGGSDAAECEPGRCLADIQKAIGEHRAEARACYDTAHKKDPKLGAGALVMNYQIGEDGHVIDATQSDKDDQLMDPELTACVAEVIKQITFAPSPKGLTTRGYHRFEFSP